MHAAERLRELGYSPISGYGFARTDDRAHVAGPVQQAPVFLYHDLVYGYDDDEIIGYGFSAMSRSPGINLCNSSNRRAYVETVLGKKTLPHDRVGRCESPERGVVTFPFRGELDKARVPWHQVPDQTPHALQEAIDADLIIDEGKRYVLTGHGLFHVNLTFHMMPDAGKQLVAQKMEEMQLNGRLTYRPDQSGGRSKGGGAVIHGAPAARVPRTLVRACSGADREAAGPRHARPVPRRGPATRNRRCEGAGDA
ncbi:hypothetical protein [Nonomuraea rubra]|uniref:hypothetical protein n=1 Tax=Nonomuraea rubra TaxID=46180 RepID=UPI0033EC2D5A